MRYSVPVRQFMVVLALFVVQACAWPMDGIMGPPPATQTAEVRAVKAHDLERQGNLAAALDEWKVVQLADPNDATAANHIHRIQGKVSTEAQLHSQRGKAALAKGKRKTARIEFLKVLAVDPRNAGAFEKLRELETRKSRRWQSAWGLDTKSMAPPNAAAQPETSSPKVQGLELYKSGRYAESVKQFEKVIEADPSDENARLYQAQAHLHLAEQALRAKDPKTADAHFSQAARNANDGDKAIKTRVNNIPKEIAQAYHQQALQTYQDDLGQAIEYWRRSRALEPDNPEWQVFLERASQLRAATHPSKSDQRSGTPPSDGGGLRQNDKGQLDDVPF